MHTNTWISLPKPSSTKVAVRRPRSIMPYLPRDYQGKRFYHSGRVCLLRYHTHVFFDWFYLHTRKHACQCVDISMHLFARTPIVANDGSPFLPGARLHWPTRKRRSSSRSSSSRRRRRGPAAPSPLLRTRVPSVTCPSISRTASLPPRMFPTLPRSPMRHGRRRCFRRGRCFHFSEEDPPTRSAIRTKSPRPSSSSASRPPPAPRYDASLTPLTFAPLRSPCSS